MDVIPVLDLARGVAMWAKAGERAGYQRVVSALAPEAAGDPPALMRAFRRRLGATACYVADLDAIQGGAVQRAMIRELAQLETGFAGAIMVDAGAHTPESTLEVLACGASQVVIGLETLRAFSRLADIVRIVGSDRVVFSVDLRLGSPILHPDLQDGPGGHPTDAEGVAARAVDAGARTVLVLDLARVGTGCGADLDLLGRLRRRWPAIHLLAGGGVVARQDLDRMRDVGCDGALVASAIHAGAITAADLADLARGAVGAQSPRVSR